MSFNRESIPGPEEFRQHFMANILWQISASIQLPTYGYPPHTHNATKSIFASYHQRSTTGCSASSVAVQRAFHPATVTTRSVSPSSCWRASVLRGVPLLAEISYHALLLHKSTITNFLRLTFVHDCSYRFMNLYQIRVFIYSPTFRFRVGTLYRFKEWDGFPRTRTSSAKQL